MEPDEKGSQTEHDYAEKHIKLIFYWNILFDSEINKCFYNVFFRSLSLYLPSFHLQKYT